MNAHLRKKSFFSFSFIRFSFGRGFSSIFSAQSYSCSCGFLSCKKFYCKYTSSSSLHSSYSSSSISDNSCVFLKLHASSLSRLFPDLLFLLPILQFSAFTSSLSSSLSLFCVIYPDVRHSSAIAHKVL